MGRHMTVRHDRNWNAPEGSPYYGLTLEQVVQMKRKKRMAEIDAYDPAIRSLVHDYGLNVVKTIYGLGVRDPRHIKHIVETVLDEFSPTRGTFSNQGTRASLTAHPTVAKLNEDR